MLNTYSVRAKTTLNTESGNLTSNMYLSSYHLIKWTKFIILSTPRNKSEKKPLGLKKNPYSINFSSSAFHINVQKFLHLCSAFWLSSILLGCNCKQKLCKQVFINSSMNSAFKFFWCRWFQWPTDWLVASFDYN